MFAYGLAIVALPLHLVAAGLSPLWLGVILALALLSGAFQMYFTDRLTRPLGAKPVAIGAALCLCLGGLFAASTLLPLIFVAAALGAVNGSAQEIGPSLPIEQVALATGARGTKQMAFYNFFGGVALGLGVLAGGALQVQVAFLIYAGCGALIAAIYGMLRFPTVHVPEIAVKRRSSGISERLAALFAVDAFAGGLISQGILVYWLASRFHPHPESIAAILAIGNVLAALSLFVAAFFAKRFGILNTMVFTHLPSNVVLMLLPLAPSFSIAAILLLVRSSLSQMDVPTRQAFTVMIVPEGERLYATSLTSAVRPFAAILSPLLSAAAFQATVIALPFLAAGAIKTCYDLAFYRAFRYARKRS
ncbi:MAG: MFS transporter [Vulcanimicrobiaceae bacterium]